MVAISAGVFIIMGIAAEAGRRVVMVIDVFFMVFSGIMVLLDYV